MAGDRTGATMAGGRGGTRFGALVAAAVAVAMGGCSMQGACDYHSHGACVQFTYDTSQLKNVQARLDSLLEHEMPFWGLHGISGWTIQFRANTDYNCYLNTDNSGCTDYFQRTLSVYVSPDDGDCFEAAPLLHELGHYTIGDPTHSDPHWQDVPGAFAEMVWNRPDAAPECVKIFQGVTTGMWPVHFNGF